MLTVELLYYLFGSLVLAGLVTILRTRQAWYAILGFLCIIITLSGLYFLQGASLVAVIQLILHAGGVLVWFVCSLWFNNEQSSKSVFVRDRPTLFWTLLLLAIGGIGMMMGWSYFFQGRGRPASAGGNETVATAQAVGWKLVGTYGLALELAGIMLLLALVVVLHSVSRVKQSD